MAREDFLPSRTYGRHCMYSSSLNGMPWRFCGITPSCVEGAYQRSLMFQNFFERALVFYYHQSQSWLKSSVDKEAREVRRRTGALWPLVQRQKRALGA